jgi:hypothetical protein
MLDVENLPKALFVKLHGRSYPIVKINFRGRNRMYSVDYRTDYGSVEGGWFTRCQLINDPIPEMPSLRQGC